MNKKIKAVRTILTGGAVVLAAGLGTAGVASASSTSHTSSTTATTTTPPNPATLTHGPGETLLTGTTLADALAAAKAAEPDATVVRAETDSGGATYEVHMEKTDGTYVTVKLDASFKVTAVEKGFGTPPSGSAPTGTPPTGTPPSGTRPTGTPPSGTPPAGAPTGMPGNVNSSSNSSSSTSTTTTA